MSMPETSIKDDILRVVDASEALFEALLDARIVLASQMPGTPLLCKIDAALAKALNVGKP